MSPSRSAASGSAPAASSTWAAKFSDTTTSRRYRADATLRYPITRELRVSPTIGVEYREGMSSDFTDKALNMKLGADYARSRNTYLEAEVGGRLSRRDDDASRTTAFDSYVFLAYRIDF